MAVVESPIDRLRRTSWGGEQKTSRTDGIMHHVMKSIHISLIGRDRGKENFFTVGYLLGVSRRQDLCESDLSVQLLCSLLLPSHFIGHADWIVEDGQCLELMIYR